MVILAVKIRCRPNQIESAEKLFSTFPSQATNERGCIQYELFRSEKDPQLFYFFEKWADQKSFDEHSEQPYLKEFHRRFDELLECPNEVLFLNPMNSI